MNHSPFWPLVWKEYRAGRAFWLSMAGLGLLAQMTAFWLTRRPTDRDWWLYGLALMVSTGFAVGIGGTLFAIEHEDRTFGLLRVLPLRPGELGGAKLLTALLGIVSLVAALWLTASVLAGWKPLSLYDVSQLWGLWGLACAEGLAWGILCSLAIRSPLRATIATLLAVSLVNEFCVTLTQTHNLAMLTSYVEAIPLRLAALVLVVAVDAWLLPRWLAGKYPGNPWQGTRRRAAAATVQLARARSWRESRPVVWHLVWQSWREGRSHVALLLIAALIGMGLFREMYWAMLSMAGTVESDSVMNQVVEFLPASLLCALVGVLAFHADQVQSPRFLAERGVSPRLVWLSRQLAWGGWLVVWGMVLAVLPLAQVQVTDETAQFLDPWWSHRPLSDRIFRVYDNQRMVESWQYWRVLFCAYAAGQFASLVARRTVLAVVLAAALGPLLAAWSWLMFSAGISAWWSVLPLPLAMLWATWLRAPDWLLSRPGRRRWIAPLAVAAAPVVLLAIEVPRARVHQIPEFWPGGIQTLAPLLATHSPEETAQAQVTYELYKQAAGLYGDAPAEEVDPDNGERKPQSPDEPWLKSLVAAMLEAASRPYNLAALSLEQRADLTQRWWFLDKLLLDDAALLESDGQFDRALEIHLALLRREAQLETCRDIEWQPEQHPDVPYGRSLKALCHWAAAEGQTPERIRIAIAALEKWHAGLPPAALRLSWTYQATRESIAGDESPYTFRTEAGELTRQLASEQERALRLLDQIAATQASQAADLETKISRNEELARWGSPLLVLIPYRGINEWLRTTPLIQRRIADFSLPWYVLARETNYRATLIILALEAWKAEHGQLPGTLDKLAGAGLEQVPLDPVYALPFLYYRTGIPAPPRPVISSAPLVELHRDPSNLAHRWTYAEFMNGQPFLWSALNQASYQILVQSQWSGDDEGLDYFRSYGEGDRQMHPNPHSAIDILEGGQAFEIP